MACTRVSAAGIARIFVSSSVFMMRRLPCPSKRIWRGSRSSGSSIPHTSAPTKILFLDTSRFPTHSFAPDALVRALRVSRLSARAHFPLLCVIIICSLFPGLRLLVPSVPLCLSPPTESMLRLLSLLSLPSFLPPPLNPAPAILLGIISDAITLVHINWKRPLMVLGPLSGQDRLFTVQHYWGTAEPLTASGKV
eukprot:590252-Rhodomonas_salina.1